ncbi:6687_t:CDS:2, partial [Dentiscutata heterogama]
MEVEDDEPLKNISEKPVISFFNENDESPSPLLPANDFLSRLQFRQAPYDVPPIYQGVRFMVYCILAKGVVPKENITLSAMSQDGPMRLEIPVDPVKLEGSKIHTLAARKLIQNLEDGTSFLHNHQKYQGKQVPNSVVRNQIVSLSKTYSLASRYTSFIAIDERDIDMTKEQDNKPLQRVVPNYIPPNYHVFGRSYASTGSSLFNNSKHAVFGAPPPSGGPGSGSTPFSGQTQKSFFGPNPAFGFGSAQTQRPTPTPYSLFYNAQAPTPALGFCSVQTQAPVFGEQPRTQAFGAQAQTTAFGFGSAQTQTPAFGAKLTTTSGSNSLFGGFQPNQEDNMSNLPNLSQFGGFAVTTHASPT